MNMRDLIKMVEATVSNRIKSKLAAELEKAQSAETPQHRVPGFLQRGHHLATAEARQSWARLWRHRALEFLPNTVANVTKVKAWPRGHDKPLRFLVFMDGQDMPLLAVIPNSPNHPYNFVELNGKSLKDVLGQGWSVG